MTATLQYFSTLWAALAPAIADHLWQSTLFALAAGLLTLALRKNSARFRYFLWLAASLKFLVPFSWLIAVGSRLSWRHVSAVPATGMYLVDAFGQPFTSSSPLTHPAAPAALAVTTQNHWWLVILGLWFCGSWIVFSVWTAHWWRVFAAIRRSALLSEGRELSTLHRLESDVGMSGQIKLLLSRSSLEPGVFGIFRPVLLWPHSISRHLDDSHLEAILAHELCHARRRDNLSAALHMLVEAVFWFHPLVWWIGARLNEERERACDEAVLELGSRPATYAESILKVCEFCLSSPLTCVSGVTGSDLKKRMVHIMTDRVIHKLNFARQLLLATAICLAIALPIAFGLLNATPSRAEAQVADAPQFVRAFVQLHQPDEKHKLPMVSIAARNGNFVASGITLQMLIGIAYHIQDTQLAGAPDWMNSQKYDIDAEVSKPVAEEIAKLNPEQRMLIGEQMVKGLLANQFKLALHQESRDLPTYELLVADGGPKLQKTSKVGILHMGRGELTSQGTPIPLLAAQLALRLGRTMVDKTGLTGNYIYSLHWTPAAEEEARLHSSGMPDAKAGEPSPTTSSDAAPPLATALQEQLGLKLQSKTERVPVLVIDHVEQPSQ